MIPKVIILRWAGFVGPLQFTWQSSGGCTDRYLVTIANVIHPDVPRWIAFVSGGVGPVTVAIVMRNAMGADQRRIAAGWL